MDIKMTDITAKHVFDFTLKILRPFPGTVAIMVLTAFCWAISLSLSPYILKIILNKLPEASPQNVFEFLAIPVVLYVLLSLFLTSIFRLYEYFIEIKMIPLLRLKIAQSSFDTLLDQSASYYQHQFAGSLANKVNDLVSSVPDITQIVIDRLLRCFLALSIATFVLWQVNFKIALTMFIWAFLFISVSLFLSKRVAHLSDIWSEWGSTIMGKMVDAFSNILSIRLFSRKNHERKSLHLVLQETVKAEQKLQWTYFWIWCLYGYTYVLMIGINFYFLMKGWQEGSITLGDFALVLAISSSIVDFLWNLTKEISDFSKFFGKIKQALRTLIVIPDIQDKPKAKALQVTKGEIVFDNIRFHYKGTQALFQNKSVIIHPGEKLGLVGYSGSGKSTFVNLILRLFDVTAGRILIDGQDIREVTQESLRECIGMIPQDPTLFHRTLKENIRYGKPEASDKEVMEAAKKAHAHEFIETLPQGYDSLVGERGVKLSGGQRQRVAIARAILKNAPLLILDEATSQLDSVTESYIQESLWNLMQGKTTIIIAHRLSTLLRMDRILVFDRGKIVEDGTHEELLKREALYKTLWDAQVGGFLPETKGGSSKK